MLAYAANAPRFGERRRSPSALMLIVGVHAVAVGVLMTTKMDIGTPGDFTRTVVRLIDLPKPRETVPPPPTRTETPQQPISQIDKFDPIIPIDTTGPVFTDPPIKQPPIGPISGTGTEYVPTPPIH